MMESLANEVVGVYSVLLVLWLRDVHNWNIALNICLNGSRTAWLSQQNGTSRLSTVYTVGETETLLTCAPALSVAIVAVTRTTCTGVTSLCVYAVALRLWAADAWVYVTLVYVWKRQREEEREGERDYDSLSSLYVSWCCVLYGFGETETEIVSHDMSSFYIP